MLQIKTYNNIALEGLEYFDRKNYELNESQDPDGIILRSKKLHDMEINPSLKAVARAGAGTNNIPTDRLSEAGVVVFNTPGANANSVKELAIASMIIQARNMHEAHTWAENLTGSDIETQVEDGKKQFKGRELKGKTLGVIGLGSIGHLVANDAYALGMKVVGYDPYISVQAAWKISQYVEQAPNLEEVISQADFLTIHVPSTPDTIGMLDAHALQLMKESAVLLNFSRTDLVDVDALVKALDRDEIAGYITDFPCEAFMNHDKITLYPHLGASTEEAETNCAVMAAKQLKQYLETGEIINSVNYPHVELTFNSTYRIAIANRNVPNMIGEISTLLSKYQINIDRIINKSREQYAYTLVDFETDNQQAIDEIISTLNTVDDILMTRLIKNKRKK